MTSADALPYRPCVGIALFNREGLVFAGRRDDAPDNAEGPQRWWQMPQGGIDEGEDPYRAALRELYEETNVRSVDYAGETPDWLTYDLPRELIGQSWNGRYRGQKQKWYAVRLTGPEHEIDVLRPGGGQFKAEFSEWRWERLERLPLLVAEFKRPVYEQVVRAFRHLAG